MYVINRTIILIQTLNFQKLIQGSKNWRVLLAGKCTENKLTSYMVKKIYIFSSDSSAYTHLHGLLVVLMWKIDTFPVWVSTTTTDEN